MTANQYRAARLSAGLSQQALADLLGVERETVNRRESGKGKIGLEAILALSVAVELRKRSAPAGSVA